MGVSRPIRLSRLDRTLIHPDRHLLVRLTTDRTTELDGTGTVVGVDGGGTTTRVIVAATDGTVLSYEEGTGSNPTHNPETQARATVRATIETALDDANRSPDEVTALTAGLAGLDDADDERWAREFTELPGLECDRIHVNDAVVAHAGALGSEPGIVAICGTGSIVLGVTDDGRHVCNYDFDHYASAAARHIGRKLLHRILADDWTHEDQRLVEDALDHWGVATLNELRESVVAGGVTDTSTSENRLDSLAPRITAAAAMGIPVAVEVCDTAAAEVETGVRSVGGYFERASVPVALLGGVLESEYVAGAVTDRLGRVDREYQVVEPSLTPVAGAAYLSIERVGVSDHDAVVGRLRDHPSGLP